MSSEATNKEEFMAGDIVQLKSGGPKMTVGVKPSSLLGSGVFCQWFSGKNLSHGLFAAATLTRPEADKEESD